MQNGYSNLKLSGQDFNYNEEKNIVTTTIKEPFWTAGKILGWKKHGAGIGINTRIIDFVQSKNARLIIHVDSVGEDYFIDIKNLNTVLNEYNCDYHKGVKLKVIPWMELRNTETLKPKLPENQTTLEDMF